MTSKTALQLAAGDLILRRDDNGERAVRLVRATLEQNGAVRVMTTSVDRTDDDATDVLTSDCEVTLAGVTS